MQLGLCMLATKKKVDQCGDILEIKQYSKKDVNFCIWNKTTKENTCQCGNVPLTLSKKDVMACVWEETEKKRCISLEVWICMEATK